LHRAGEAGQVACPGVRHYRDAQFRHSTRHDAAVMQNKTAAAATQRSGYALNRDETPEPFTSVMMLNISPLLVASSAP
jgi:hypothetical protein